MDSSLLIKKIIALKQRSNSDQLLSQVSGFSALLEEVRKWKERRNSMMHSIVETARDWKAIDADAKLLAEDGREILGRFAAVVMRVRKRYKQAGN